MQYTIGKVEKCNGKVRNEMLPRYYLFRLCY
jgi:hypothetical protein